MRLLAILMLVACGGPPASTTTPIDHQLPPPDAPVAEPLFDAIFEPGRTWRFRGEHVVSMGSEREVTPYELVCVVEDVQTPLGYRTARVRCDDESSHVGGLYYGDERGLWRIDEVPDRPPPLTEIYLAAAPVAGREEGNDGDEWYWHREVSQKGDAWCVSTGGGAEHESWESLCFAAGKGIVGGTRGYGAAAVEETTFEQVE